MKLLEKIQNPDFWKNFFKVGIPFFILVTLISLFLNSWSAIFSGDFKKVAEVNFSDGKWINFWSMKLIVSVIYGLYVTNKNMK